MMRALDVHLYDAHVATVSRRGENLQLRYLPEYVETDNPVPISVTLPVVTTPFGNDDTKRFLDNLLPDRADVRSRWAREAKLTSDSTFDLLSVYGADVAGALEFYPAGASPKQEENLTPLTEKEIGDRIRQIRRDDSDWLQHRAVEEGSRSAARRGSSRSPFATASGLSRLGGNRRHTSSSRASSRCPDPTLPSTSPCKSRACSGSKRPHP